MNKKLLISRIFVVVLAIYAIILLYFSRTPTLFINLLSCGFAGIVGGLFVASSCFWGFHRFLQKGTQRKLPLSAIIGLLGGFATCVALYTHTPLYAEFSLAKDSFVSVLDSSRQVGNCEETTDKIGSYSVYEVCPGLGSDATQFKRDPKTGFLNAPGGRQQAENFFRGRATIISLGDSWFYCYQQFYT